MAPGAQQRGLKWKYYNYLHNRVIVQTTISMCSMLILKGSAGMPPTKILNIRYSEIKFVGILFQVN